MQNLAALLMQMERIEEDLNSRLMRLKERTVQGESGDGLIKATGDIWFNVKSIHVDREMLAAGSYDLTSLENLLVEAVNNTLGEARLLLKTEIGGIIGGQVPPEFANFFGRNPRNGN